MSAKTTSHQPVLAAQMVLYAWEMSDALFPNPVRAVVPKLTAFENYNRSAEELNDPEHVRCALEKAYLTRFGLVKCLFKRGRNSNRLIGDISLPYFGAMRFNSTTFWDCT